MCNGVGGGGGGRGGGGAERGMQFCNFFKLNNFTVSNKPSCI